MRMISPHLHIDYTPDNQKLKTSSTFIALKYHSLEHLSHKSEKQFWSRDTYLQPGLVYLRVIKLESLSHTK